MTESASGTKVVTAQCFCKSLHFTLTLKTSDLPLATHLCHCSICRRTHGTLCIFHAPLPSGVAPSFVAPSSLDKLTAYRGPGCPSVRYFCSTCGCHMGDVSPEEGEWVVSTSLFLDNEPPIYQIRSHVHTDSAPSGGLNDFLLYIGDREMKIWNPEKDETAVPEVIESEYGADGEERLRAECHCGGVSFTIPRPNQRDIEDPVIGKFVSPVDKSKWCASSDACDSCRLTSGVHVMTWTFVPIDRVEPAVGPDLLPVAGSTTTTTMKTFASSPGVLRSFCGVCGATVFYNAQRRPSVVDVAVGLLRAPEGVRAENWLTWADPRVYWEEDILRYDQELSSSLSKGFKEWSERKYGGTNPSVS